MSLALEQSESSSEPAYAWLLADPEFRALAHELRQAAISVHISRDHHHRLNAPTTLRERTQLIHANRVYREQLHASQAKLRDWLEVHEVAGQPAFTAAQIEGIICLIKHHAISGPDEDPVMDIIVQYVQSSSLLAPAS